MGICAKLHGQRRDDFLYSSKLFTNIPRDDSALTAILFMTKEHNSGLRVSPTVWSCDTVNTEIRESEMVHMPTLTKD